MAQPNVNDTQVAKVTQFIKDTTAAIMATTTSAPGTEVVPLHFVRDAVIEHQHYILELHKEQGSLWLKELSVSWVPKKDANPPGDMFCTIVTNNVEHENLVGCGGRGSTKSSARHRRISSISSGSMSPASDEIDSMEISHTQHPRFGLC